MAADFKVAQPKEYYRKFLEEDVRPDGRELGEVRPIVLNVGSIGTADGSALVKLGNTTVLCGIKGELTTPKPDTPKHGYIVPNVDLPPMCSAKFKPGPPGETAQGASQFMQEVIMSSKCIQLEDLCIEEGKLVWVLFCDLVCLAYDGNLLDACVMSLVAALRNVMLPTVKIDDDTGLPSAQFNKKCHLNMRTSPVACTLAVFDDRILFVDPTDEEEELASGVITMVTLEDGSLCNIHKPGCSRISQDQIQMSTDKSLSQASVVRHLIEDTLNSLDR